MIKAVYDDVCACVGSLKLVHHFLLLVFWQEKTVGNRPIAAGCHTAAQTASCIAPDGQQKRKKKKALLVSPGVIDVVSIKNIV